MLSFIEEHEAQEAKELIQKNLGFPLPDVRHDYMAVKLFIRPEDIFTVTDKDGREVKFYLPETSRCWDKFRNCGALVISMGEGCGDASFRVGDFIVIPRNEGVQVNYYGYVLHFLKYDKIYAVIKEPDKIEKR